MPTASHEAERHNFRWAIATRIFAVDFPMEILVGVCLASFRMASVSASFSACTSVSSAASLLILWVDEVQRFMTASEDGTSDYNCVDVIREAGATVVAAAQSTTSLVPPLGNEKSKVPTLNLRNRMIFRSADEADAVQAADFIGKKRAVKRSWGCSSGKRNVNYNETEEHKIKPHELRNLRDHECVHVHCERGFRRVTLAPLEANRTAPKWFPRWRRLL
jgi:hypothetical protein